MNGDPFVIHPLARDDASPETPEQLEARAKVLLNDANIVRVAELLEVEPLGELSSSAIAISTSDGRAYDWFELMSAHLRRIA